MHLDLAKITPGYPVGWLYELRTRGQLAQVYHRKKVTILCDVSGCSGIPKYEIYFGARLGKGKVYQPRIRGISEYWWYVCKQHKDWLRSNSKKKEA